MISGSSCFTSITLACLDVLRFGYTFEVGVTSTFLLLLTTGEGDPPPRVAGLFLEELVSFFT